MTDDDSDKPKGTLADQLASLDLDVPDQPEQTSDGHSRSAERTSRPEEPVEPAEPAEPAQPVEPELSDEELFRQAVEGMSPEEVYRGKFGRPEDAEEPVASAETKAAESTTGEEDASTNRPEEDEEEARQAVREIRDMRMFEEAIGGVDERLEDDKFHRPEPKPPPEPAYTSDSPEDLITPPLPKSGRGLNEVGKLTGPQREMRKRFEKRTRRRDPIELNVRGDTLDDALRQVELFMHQAWKDGERFVRIIHGRGIRSDGEPVLKPAILRWLEGPGFRYVRGYIPEVGPGGDYGSLIVELDART